MNHIDQLRADYRSAFREYARSFDRLDLLRRENGAAGSLEDALLELQKARLAYNAVRDRLAERLGDAKPEHMEEVELAGCAGHSAA